MVIFIFSRWRPPPSWIFKISIFQQSAWSRGWNCITMPNFVDIASTVAEISQFFDISRWQLLPSWIFEILIMMSFMGYIMYHNVICSVRHYFCLYVCMYLCVFSMMLFVCMQLAEAASQVEGPLTLLSWRDQLQRLAWCIRFAQVTKRSE